jgi:hypothetical protein
MKNGVRNIKAVAYNVRMYSSNWWYRHASTVIYEFAHMPENC